MPLDQAQSVLLKHFSLTRTCPFLAAEGEWVATPLVTYRSAPAISSPFTTALSESVTFPIVRTRDGAPWFEACLYLVRKFYEENLHIRTCISLAKDLSLYRRYLDESDLDFKEFPESKFNRVTYRYRAYLKLQVNSGAITLKTAKRKVSCVISFYKWIGAQGVFKPSNPPWISKEVFIPIQGGHRGGGVRSVITSDLAFKGSSPIDSSIITDGGRLRPVPSEVQLDIIAVLHELNNPEMYMGHLFALFTGARMQTVFTMRRETIVKCTRGPNNCAHIKVGPGTGVDTKKGVRYVLVVPWGVVEMLRQYIDSERAKKRLSLSQGARHQNQGYLFLTNRGEPYYQSAQDPGYSGKRYLSEGAAVRQYIHDRIIPALSNRLGGVYKYSFHDLRASFAMNLYDSLWPLLVQGGITVSELREYIRFRLGHVSDNALDSYLKFNNRTELSERAQHDWERNLEKLCAR
jgi:hypothetical protein